MLIINKALRKLNVNKSKLCLVDFLSHFASHAMLELRRTLRLFLGSLFVGAFTWW